MQRAAEMLRDPSMSAYGACSGMPELCTALKEKLAAENGLTGVRLIGFRVYGRLVARHAGDVR